MPRHDLVLSGHVCSNTDMDKLIFIFYFLALHYQPANHGSCMGSNFAVCWIFKELPNLIPLIAHIT